MLEKVNCEKIMVRKVYGVKTKKSNTPKRENWFKKTQNI